jgi:hypothetical protein
LEEKRKKREDRRKAALPKAKKNDLDLADAEIHCPSNLKDIIDDSDDDFENHF